MGSGRTPKVKHAVSPVRAVRPPGLPGELGKERAIAGDHGGSCETQGPEPGSSTAGHRPSFPIRSTSALELVGPFSAAGGVTVGLVSTIDVRHGKAVLAELRKAQRRQRTADFDAFEALYRVYITGLMAGVGLWLLSGVVGDKRVDPTTAARVAADGPQLVGCAVALALAIGLRAGARGGPLVIEAADVRHVLLAPVDRATALRGPALRLLRFGGAAGAGVGAVIGLLAFRRLPGPAAGWVVCGAVVGLLTVDAALGAAMLAAGLRLGRVVVGALALGVLGWSAVDVAIGRATSPASLLGQLALWPLRWRPEAFGGVAAAAIVVLLGVATVGGTSIEASERRARLAGQIRFAATVRDLRTVIVLRRQLAQELPRQRPWIRATGRLFSPARSRGRRVRWPVWRRGWQGILRFPYSRLVRMALLAAAAGLAAVGAWRGSTPLLFLAGVALYVVGLDAVEPLAQEVDHPTLLESYPRPAGAVLVRHLACSAALMATVGVVGVAAAVAVEGGNPSALAVAAVVWLPASLAALAGASVATLQGPPPLFSSTDSLMPPEVAGARAVIRTVWPPLIATAGVAPILAGRHAESANVAVKQVGSAALAAILLPAVVVYWVRYRQELHEFVKQMLAPARPQARSGA